MHSGTSSQPLELIQEAARAELEQSVADDDGKASRKSAPSFSSGMQYIVVHPKFAGSCGMVVCDALPDFSTVLIVTSEAAVPAPLLIVLGGGDFAKGGEEVRQPWIFVEFWFWAVAPASICQVLLKKLELLIGLSRLAQYEKDDT